MTENDQPPSDEAASFTAVPQEQHTQREAGSIGDSQEPTDVDAIPKKRKERRKRDRSRPPLLAADEESTLLTRLRELQRRLSATRNAIKDDKDVNVDPSVVAINDEIAAVYKQLHAIQDKRIYKETEEQTRDRLLREAAQKLVQSYESAGKIQTVAAVEEILFTEDQLLVSGGHFPIFTGIAYARHKDDLVNHAVVYKYKGGAGEELNAVVVRSDDLLNAAKEGEIVDEDFVRTTFFYLQQELNNNATLKYLSLAEAYERRIASAEQGGKADMAQLFRDELQQTKKNIYQSYMLSLSMRKLIAKAIASGIPLDTIIPPTATADANVEFRDLSFSDSVLNTVDRNLYEGKHADVEKHQQVQAIIDEVKASLSQTSTQ